MENEGKAATEPAAQISTPLIFGKGEEVRVAEKSRLVDRERAHEDLAPEARVPIDMDVTGVEGKVCGTPYNSTTKDGDVCVPIELADGNVLAVPADRLEKTNKTPRRLPSDQVTQRGSSPISADTMKFWEEEFRKKYDLEKENERLRRENEELKKERGHA